MSLVIIIAIVLITFIFGLYQKRTNGVCKSRKRLDGKTALVTGGTAGMGLEIATDLAERGAKVIVACPFEEEGNNARKQIIENTGNEQVFFMLLDLASLDSVRKFAADVLAKEERLDLLMNNAGVGIPADYLTDDGLNFILQVNYFGHFLLTLLLLPLLRKTGTISEPSRVVNTSSVLHQIGKLDIDKMNAVNYWYKIQIYGNSKFFVIPFSRELTRKIGAKNIVINNVDPGNVGTRIFDCCGKLAGHFVTFVYSNFFKTPWEGAQTAIHAAVDKKAGQVSGELFKDCNLYKGIRSAYDDKIAKQLWEESARLVKLSDEDVRQCFKTL